MSEETKALTCNSRNVWRVERLNSRGEELPVIRHIESWHLAPLALRYFLRTRFYLGPNSLTRDAHVVALAYNWAEEAAEIGNLEEFILSGQTPARDQIFQLSCFLRRSYRNRSSGLVSNHAYNSRLFAVSQFLQWALEPTNHGGSAVLDEDQIESEISKVQRIFERLKVSVGRSQRLEPLTDLEIRLIRQAIGPDEFGEFPPDVFTERTRYRNWIMFEKVLNFGHRKGELLATKLQHVARCRSDGRIFIPRQQDDEADPRRRQPRGKTNERLVRPMSKDVLPSLLRYCDSPPPLGRNDPAIVTPYFWVTEDGSPLSIRAADYIIKQIGKYAARRATRETGIDDLTRESLIASLLGLTWHRVRHTWAEQAALGLYSKYGEGAWPILKEWGGWNDESSMEHYIRLARRSLSDRAAREYQASLTL
jgi:hypothetical protein